jgi:CheY-like chemotaxis protein
MKNAESTLIFVVDDNPVNIKVLLSLLQDKNFKILIATNGGMLLKKLSVHLQI